MQDASRRGGPAEDGESLTAESVPRNAPERHGHGLMATSAGRRDNRLAKKDHGDIGSMGPDLRLTARTLKRRDAAAGLRRRRTSGQAWGQPKTDAVAGDATQLFARGVELERHGNWSGAAAAFEAALERAPDMARACDRLGFALGQLGRTADAIARFRQAAAMSPQLFDAHYHLGATLWWTRDLDGALAALQRAVAIDPRHAEAQ